MGCLSAQQNLSALVPMPNYIETQEGKAFVVTEKTQIVITDASLQFEAEALQRVFKAQMGLELNIQTGFMVFRRWRNSCWGMLKIPLIIA